MEKPIEEIKIDEVTVKFYQDTDAQSPADWGDENLFLVHYHRDFWQENKDVTERDLRDLYQGNKTETTRRLQKEYYIFPVAALIHSGVWLKLGHGGFSMDEGGWDTSHVGALFASKKEFKSKGDAEKCATGKVTEWNHYLSGDVYGFVVEDKDGEDLDSCWGFYGLKYAKEEGLSMAKYHSDELQKKKAEKVKAFIKNKVSLDKREKALTK